MSYCQLMKWHDWFNHGFINGCDCEWKSSPGPSDEMHFFPRQNWLSSFRNEAHVERRCNISLLTFGRKLMLFPSHSRVENVTLFLSENTKKTNVLITLRLVQRQKCSNLPCFGRLSVWMLYMLHCGWCAVSRGSAGWIYSHPLILQWSMGWHMVSALLCVCGGESDTSITRLK